MKKPTKQITKARKQLRNLYKKYTDELFEVVTKIDKFLEGIQEEDGNR